MRKAFTALLALMLVAGFVSHIGSTARARQTSSGGTTVLSNSGDPYATVSVDAIADPFEGYDASSPPPRGFRFVMLTVSITNDTDTAIDPYPYAIAVVDQDGFLAQSTYVYRTDTTVPDFPSDAIEPGATATGALFFQVLASSDVAEIVYMPGYSQLYVLASDVAAPASGAPVTILGEEGGELGTVTISDVTDPYKEVDPSYAPPRGYHYVAATITFENTSSRPISVDPSTFVLVDGDGFAATPSGAYRGDAPEVPDFQYTDVAPGESLTGVVTYEVFNDAAPARIYYSAGGTQLVTLVVFDGAPEPSSIADIPAAAAATPGASTATATEEASAVVEETGDCVGVNEWFTRLNDRSSALDAYDFSIDTAADLENVDVDTLNNYVDDLDALLKEQKADTPPAAAQDLSDEYISYIELQIDALNAVIDAKDAGDDLQAVFDEWEPQITAAASSLTDTYSALAKACPASGL